MLKARERAGEIEVLKVQDTVYLTEARIKYIPDFRCLDKKTGETFWVEAKGLEMVPYRIKRQLWTVYGPGVLEVFKARAGRLYLHETIIPAKQKVKTAV